MTKDVPTELLPLIQDHQYKAVRQCFNCEYWVLATKPALDEDDNVRVGGYCRHNPPQSDGEFPLADFDMWCGQYKARNSTFTVKDLEQGYCAEQWPSIKITHGEG